MVAKEARCTSLSSLLRSFSRRCGGMMQLMRQFLVMGYLACKRSGVNALLVWCSHVDRSSWFRTSVPLSTAMATAGANELPGSPSPVADTVGGAPMALITERGSVAVTERSRPIRSTVPAWRRCERVHFEYPLEVVDVHPERGSLSRVQVRAADDGKLGALSGRRAYCPVRKLVAAGQAG
ncbi:hypothetical protein AB0L59_26520 [Streptomyces sp. NPDC052109]|uniref:hypothetical protein n=1 Tax=Streptomyces sp. NPDC052109 TaxID=3155527 RepID=UPI00342A71E9